MVAPVAPAKVSKTILSPLPKLYVYDHCPFCVRVRLAFGLKNLKYDCQFMANDDIPTPTAMVGKKIAPIFTSESTSVSPMPESLDIIKLVDADPAYGEINVFKPESGRTDLKAWQKTVKETNRIIQRPRYMMAFLPEFASNDAKEAFVFNHPVPPYEKPEWKEELTSDIRWSKYEAAYQDSLGLVGEVNEALTKLEPLIFCEDYCTEGGLSYDDIDLWARLRSLTILKGIVWPEKLRKYMDNLSAKGDVPLYDCMAC